MRGRRIGWVLLTLLAGQALADPGDMARLAQSERLEVYALGQALALMPDDIALAQDLRAGLTRQGFYHSGPPAVIDATLSVTPVLRRDPNVNGGLPGDRLVIGGVVLELDPARRARAATVLGFGLAAGARIGWGEGRFLSLDLAGQAGGAPGDGATVTAGSAVVCAQTHLAGWTFADLCRGVTTATRDLVAARSLGTELRLSYLFGAAGGQHELALSLAETGGTARLGISAESLWGGVATRFALTLAEPGAGESGTARAITADLRWLDDGRTAGLRLALSESPETGFLGLARQDRRVAVDLLRDLGRGLSVTAGWSRTFSTVDLFDDSALSLSLSFDLD